MTQRASLLEADIDTPSIGNLSTGSGGPLPHRITFACAPLEAPGAGIAEVRALLEFYALANGSPAWGRGCLLCNTAVEFGPDDPSGSGFVQRYFERLSGAFQTALENAHRRGGLRASVDPRQEADFFTASVLGLFVMLRAKAPSTVIEGAAHVAIEHLEALRADAPHQ